jgi:hypothetical protein
VSWQAVDVLCRALLPVITVAGFAAAAALDSWARDDDDS